MGHELSEADDRAISPRLLEIPPETRRLILELLLISLCSDVSVNEEETTVYLKVQKVLGQAKRTSWWKISQLLTINRQLYNELREALFLGSFTFDCSAVLQDQIPIPWLIEYGSSIRTINVDYYIDISTKAGETATAARDLRSRLPRLQKARIRVAIPDWYVRFPRAPIRKSRVDIAEAFQDVFGDVDILVEKRYHQKDRTLLDIRWGE